MSTDMMQKMQVFNNEEFGKVRTIIKDGEPWFIGKDVAVALGYSNASKAVSQHVNDKDKQFIMNEVSNSQNGNLVKTAIINESGLYSLVMSSKLDKAQKFKYWITSEVIPSIRKTGSYNINDQFNNRIPKTFGEALILAGKAQLENERLLKQAEENAPKVEYFDNLVERKLNLSLRDTGKELKIGQNNFINYLINKGFIFRNSQNKLVPYAEYIDKGYFEMREFANKNGKSGLQTLVTVEGRQYFLNRFIKEGIISSKEENE